MLSEDSTLTIFSFLDLHCVLKYASTSKSSMKETIPTLMNRRKRLTRRLLWKKEKSSNTLCEDFYPTCTHNNNTTRGDPQVGYDCDVNFIPSVLERLQCLHRSLENTQHPYRNSIHDIIQDIESFQYYEDWKASSLLDSFDFEQVCDLFRKVTSAHKKHTDILRSVLYKDSISFMALYSYDGHTLRVPLPVYTGNLLIIFFCMGHCVSGIVEGFSENKWLTKLLHDFSKRTIEQEGSTLPSNISPIDLYHSFLFYHGTILRTYPLRPMQMIELGLANQTMVDFMTSGTHGGNRNHDVLLEPLHIMRGMDKALILDKIMKRGGVTESCSVFSTTFEFGSLGPAFRGRDNISHIYFTPTVHLGVQDLMELEDIYKCNRTNYASTRNATFTVLDNANRSLSHPLHALINVFRESTKVRPITVEQPRIIFVINHATNMNAL